MDRSAIFVDAGYLFAAGGELCCGTRARRRLELDTPGVNCLLVRLAQERCQLPVLRTYWYDGARKGIATPSQQAVAALANVKLRLGRLNTRNEQKGVDALIYRDLMTLARERAVTDAFLLSGDEDLREGVRAAQDMGVRVTLLGIRAVSQQFNQSRELVHEADEIIELTVTDLSPFFSQTATPAVVAPTPPPQLDEATIEKHGHDFATAWLAKATEADKGSLVGQRPRIPKTLDVELMKFVERRAQASLRGLEPLHRATRRGFWKTVDAEVAKTAEEAAAAGDPS